jgi:hypothetical protein
MQNPKQDISTGNTRAYIYLRGREDENDSIRFSVDENKDVTVIETRTNDRWKSSAIKTSGATVWLGEIAGLVSAGHHVAVKKTTDHLHLFAHSVFDGETSTTDARIINAYTYTERDVLLSDNTGTWTGTTFEFTIPTTRHTLINKAYFQTDTTAASEPVRFRIWEGTDDTGTLIFDQTYPASLFVASSEISDEAEGYIGLDPDSNYFFRLNSDADFSLKTNSGGTQPWFASDISDIREDDMLQTEEWSSGNTFAVGDWTIQNNKIYVCNTAGVQTGTFTDNIALWDVITDVDALWTRTDTTVSPSTAGDDISTTGNIITTGTIGASGANLADGVTATTQGVLDNSTKVATTAYVDAAVLVEDHWYRDVSNTILEPQISGDNIGTSGYVRGDEGFSIGGEIVLDHNATSRSTSVGYRANASVTSTGLDNYAFGYDALYSNTTGDQNVAIGQSALYNLDGGDDNVAIGSLALVTNVSGEFNTGVGTFSLRYATGDENTAIGHDSGINITTGSNNIAIGHNAQVASPTGDNQISIGNTIYGNTSTGYVGMGTTAPEYPLHVSHASAGYALIETDLNGGDTGLLFRNSVGENGYVKGGIFFKNDLSGNGRGDMYFALENTSDSSNVDVTDAKMTIFRTGDVSVNNGDFQVINVAEGTTGALTSLYHSTTTPANGDEAGSIDFNLDNSASAETTFASINVAASEVTSTTESGTLTIDTIRDGTASTRLEINRENTIVDLSGSSTGETFEIRDPDEYPIFIADGKLNIDSTNLNTPYGAFGRTQNRLVYSEDLTKSSWLKFNGATVTGDNTTAPNGETTADRLTRGTADLALSQAASLVNGNVYTCSFWAKASSPSSVDVEVTFGDGIAGGVTVSDAYWKRYHVTQVAGATGDLDIDLTTSGAVIWLWGLQVNDGSTPYQYAKTEINTITTDDFGLAVNGDITMPASGEININDALKINEAGFEHDSAITTFAIDKLGGENLDLSVYDGGLLNIYVETGGGVTFDTPYLAVDTDTLYVDSSTDRVGIGDLVPLSPLHISELSASSLQESIRVCNPSSTAGTATGMMFSVSPEGQDYAKAGIFFEYDTSWARGDLIFALDNAADTNDVSLADEKMRLSREGDLTVSVGNAIVSNGNIQAYGAGGVSSNFCGGQSAGNSLIGGALNTFVGVSSGNGVDEGDQNTLVGYNTGNGFTYESFVTAVGSAAAGGTATSLNRSVALGAQALSGASSSQYTVAIGMGAGRDATSQDSVFLGYQVGEDETENRKLIIGNRYNNLIEGSFYNYWMNINSSINTPYGGFGRYQNLCRYSEDLSLSPWIDYLSYTTIVTNNATAPNGETTADTVTWDTLGRGLRHINLGLVNGQTYTVSFWARAVTQDSQTLEIDLGDGTAGSVAVLSGQMRRYSVTLTATANDWMDLEYNGTAGDAFDFWGFQVNDGSVAYNYLKTTDVILDTEGIGATVEGSLYTESITSSGDITLLNDQEDYHSVIFDSNEGSIAPVGKVKFQTNSNDILSLVGQLTSPTNDYGEWQFWTKGSDGLQERFSVDENGILMEGTYTVRDIRDDLNMTTGWMYGGQVTINGGDNTLIDVSPGYGIIVDYSDTTARIPSFEYVSWDQQTGLDPGFTGRSTYVYVETGGTFAYYVDPTPAVRRDGIQLARLLSATGDGTISSVLDFENPSWGQGTAFVDYAKARGSWTISGNQFTPNNSNLLLDRASGSTFRYHAEDTIGEENVHTESSATGITTYNYHLQGTNTTTVESDIDPDNWDNAGSKTAMTTDYWSIQEVWFFPVSGTTHVLYGQAEYESKGASTIGLYEEAKVRNDEILDGAVFRSYLIVQEGMTSLDEAIIIQEPLVNKPQLGQGRVPSFVNRSYAISDYGSNDTFYAAGFYEAPVADVTLTIGGTVTQTLGTASKAEGAHAFCVASGAGGTDLVLTVSGTSITDGGVRTTSDSEVIVADTDQATTDQYFETTKKWLGQITYTLTGTSGSFTFNYGFAKYEDFGNRDFTATDFEIVGLCNLAANDLNVELLHHQSTGWTYHATAFVPGSTAICDMATDYSTDQDIEASEYFAYKRSNLSTDVDGSGSEGVLVRMDESTNNSIRYGTIQIGVLI